MRTLVQAYDAAVNNPFARILLMIIFLESIGVVLNVLFVGRAEDIVAYVGLVIISWLIYLFAIGVYLDYLRSTGGDS